MNILFLPRWWRQYNEDRVVIIWKWAQEHSVAHPIAAMCQNDPPILIRKRLEIPTYYVQRKSVLQPTQYDIKQVIDD